MIGVRPRIFLALVAFVLWYYCSPWAIVIQRRGDVGQSSPDTDVDASPAPAQDPNPQEQSHAKDTIEKDFGALEEAYLKSIKTPSGPPKLSRDDAIDLIYNINQPTDWLNLIEGQDGHGLMTLTKATQRYIYEKQNPTDCSGQNFLILRKFPGDDAFGLGAVIQRIADYLSVAIQTNTILLYATDSSPGEHFISEPDTDSKSCGRSFDCIFEKLSHCSSKAQHGAPTNPQGIFADASQQVDLDLDVAAYLARERYPVPPLFEAALKTLQPDITGEMLKYWWRAQAAAYIMRFNSEASHRLRELRLGGAETKQLGIQWDLNGDPKDTATVPFPMPEGTISIHVRHGDKGSEMRLVPFNDYVVRAEKFVAENPLGTWKRGFLSTEDPNVVEQMKAMPRITPFSYSGSNSRWTWYWSDIPRLNTGPETQLKEFGNRTELTLKWVLQLTMAVECDVFVGTRGSGWNRLIDSLRCAWLASCKKPFLEVGFDNDWAGYGP